MCRTGTNSPRTNCHFHLLVKIFRTHSSFLPNKERKPILVMSILLVENTLLDWRWSCILRTLSAASFWSCSCCSLEGRAALQFYACHLHCGHAGSWSQLVSHHCSFCFYCTRHSRVVSSPNTSLSYFVFFVCSFVICYYHTNRGVVSIAICLIAQKYCVRKFKIFDQLFTLNNVVMSLCLSLCVKTWESWHIGFSVLFLQYCFLRVKYARLCVKKPPEEDTCHNFS